MIKKWTHLSNATDDMLIAWYKTSAFKKLQWLEETRQFYCKAVPKKKRALYCDVLRNESKNYSQ